MSGQGARRDGERSGTDEAHAGPLAGMRVVELAHIMAGPVCGLMLADMGADVIKVEKVAGGDDSRRFLPPDIGGESAAFMMMNRNKRGIALDLKHPDGREVLLRLLREADVVVENYRHDTMTRLGLDRDTLHALNPGLIHCEISGFGRTGPYRERGGFDLIAQGMSGLMSITGEGPERPPVKLGPPVTDITAGILAAMGACAAYAHRLAGGTGQRVDTSLFEAGITHTYWQSAIAFASGVAPGPMGSAHPINAPYQALATRDGWLNLGAANQANWLRLLELVDVPALATDPRFRSNAERMANREALVVELEKVFVQRDTADWIERLNAVGIPAGPILDVTEMHRDPQTVAREMVVEVEHPSAGCVRTLGCPVKFHGTPGRIARAAPLLGEHTREVLAEAGYTADGIERLLADGAAAAPAEH